MSRPRPQSTPTDVREIPIQPASEDIWDKKYRLKTKDGQVLDEAVDDTWKRVARALAEVEETDKQEHWYEQFLWALRRGAIPAGRITSNAGAWAYKPSTSTINCTVSGTIRDSMDDILEKVHEAGLTLKAGCVAPDTTVVTEQGTVTARRAVEEKHREMLCYDRDTGRFEMRAIEEHMETRVPRSENIEIRSNAVALKTSIKHPVLVYRDGRSVYVRADEVRPDDALVHYTMAWEADSANALRAWFAGAHLGDGSAYEKAFEYKSTRTAWKDKARAAGKRFVFKIRAAEREVVEQYAEFFHAFCGSRARVVSTATENGTPVWDYTVASFEASRAVEFIDHQVGSKTKSLHVPSWVAEDPQSHLLPFLAGLIDTDGTVSRERGSVSLTMKSPAFAEQLRGLLGLFGVHGAVSRRKPREHAYRGNRVRDTGGAMLKISDSDFLERVAAFMADSGKRKRIAEHRSRAGQYDRYVMPDQLRSALEGEVETLSHQERQSLGFYHGYHRRSVISRIWLDRWQARFPHLQHWFDLARTLRPVEAITRDLDIGETFYDFTVEKHHNYVAGEAGLMVIHNCGIGYEFSTLRPRGAFVAGAGAYTSGPLSFMDIYDRMCFTVSSAGGRRGAQMGTFDIGHPDVMDFIRAKREDGRLRQFNLSLLITREFMEAVQNNDWWHLAFPVTEAEAEVDGLDLHDPEQVIWRDWPQKEGYIVDDEGRVACRIYRTLKARRLWDMIMTSTYDYAEPGFILIDKVNEMNNNWFCEEIRATNPCGEQPLPPYGSCWTGAMRLTTNHGVLRTDEAHRLVQAGEDLEIAVDSVFSGGKTDLRPCNLISNGEREVFEYRFDNGQRIELTADHQVYTPSGWREAGDLSEGDEVHMQARELDELDLVDPFHAGILRYMLPRYSGDEIIITRQVRRAFLRPVLDRLRVNYRDRAKGLFISRHHPVIAEVEGLSLEGVSREMLEGYAYAAQATSGRYKSGRAVYADESTASELAGVLGRLVGEEVRYNHHRNGRYRVVLPELELNLPTSSEVTEDLDCAVYGWLLADGWLTESAGMLFSDQDDGAMERLAPRFEAMTGTGGTLRKTYEGEARDVYSLACYRQKAVEGLRAELGLGGCRSTEVRVPDRIWSGDPVQQASFLTAVFCADGGIAKEKPLVNLVSASREWLEDIQLLLLNFGIHGTIHSSISKGNVFYSLLLQQQDSYRFYRHIGFRYNSAKQALLERHLMEKQRWRAPREAHTARLQSIRPLGVQPVYDIEEPSTNTLIVNGVVVHNCLLGSVNLTKFVREPFTEQVWFDWEEYREVVSIFTRMLDNVVEINGLPLEQQRDEIFGKRRHGMGFLGLGST
ncbi:MAG: LAGLIDADG family homing endonuclease, partial [Pseudomonadota bacterium]